MKNANVVDNSKKFDNDNVISIRNCFIADVNSIHFAINKNVSFL